MHSPRSDIVGGEKRGEANPIGRQGLGKESQEARRARGSAGISLAELGPARRAQESAESYTEFVHLLSFQRV